MKFCTYCGAKQPLDRAAYELEHPELANALSEEEQQELERQRQIEEAERQRIEAERLAQEEAERRAREEANRQAREEALAQNQVAQQYPKYQEDSLGNQPPLSSGYNRGYNPNYEQQPQQGSTTYSNLIGCPECGQLISPRAASCPHCGNPMRAPIAEQGGVAGAGVGYNPPKEKDNSKTALTILVVALIAAVALLGGFVIYQNKEANSGTELSASNSEDSVEATVEPPIAGQQEVAVQPNRTSGEEQPNALSYHNSDSPIDCSSENLDGYNTHVSQSDGTTFEGKSVYINDAWLEHEVEEGIKIHVSMKATNLLGCSVRVVCLFYFDDGRQIKDTDRHYCSNGQVCTSVNVTPSYDESTWQNLQLWIPYTQLKNKHDWKHLKCRLKVYNDGHCLATSDYMHFGCVRY